MDRSGYVAVVGGINMDIQGRSTGAFRPGDSNPGSAFMSPGGVGRNVAENLVRLGIRTELVAVLGDDSLSAALAESCGRLGIGLRGAMRLSQTAASQYLCLLDDSGALVGAVAAMDSIERLTPERLAERSGLLDGAAMVVADANLPAATLAWLAERYGGEGEGSRPGRRGPLLVLDPVSVAKAAKAVDLVGSFAFAKPNRAEAEVLSGLAIASRDDLPAAAAALRAKGLGQAFVSMGREGLYYEGVGASGLLERGFVRPPALPVANVSGAGDAALAALVWGQLSDYTIKERAALASAAAALAASAPTTVSPDMGAARLLELAKGVVHE
ncbi:MAG: hypothetical protein JNG85_05480 [Spirochaetaceae bacterium]|nr:hypothetical protein [Spirochaetaceae bacterium]